MRKVHVQVTVGLFIKADDDVDISEVVNEMDYSFTSNTSGAEIEDTEILDHEVTDSR